MISKVPRWAAEKNFGYGDLYGYGSSGGYGFNYSFGFGDGYGYGEGKDSSPADFAAIVRSVGFADLVRGTKGK